MAVNVCQGSTTRPDQVTLIFGRLYQHYNNIAAAFSLLRNSSEVEAILTSLQTRWDKMDHSLFIVALVLNPFIKRTLLNVSFNNFRIIDLVEKLYCRMFKVYEAPDTLGQRVLSYLSNCGDVFGYEHGQCSLAQLQKWILVCMLTPVLSCH